MSNPRARRIYVERFIPAGTKEHPSLRFITHTEPRRGHVVICKRCFGRLFEPHGGREQCVNCGRFLPERMPVDDGE